MVPDSFAFRIRERNNHVGHLQTKVSKLQVWAAHRAAATRGPLLPTPQWLQKQKGH